MGLSPLREVAPVIRSLAERALEWTRLSQMRTRPCVCLPQSMTTTGRRPSTNSPWPRPAGRDRHRFIWNAGGLSILGSGRREEAVEQLRLAVQGDPLHFTHRGHPGGVPGCDGTLCRGRGAAPAEQGAGSQFLLDPLLPGGHLHRAPDVCQSASVCRKGVFLGALVPSTYWHVRGTIGSNGSVRPRAGGAQSARFERGLWPARGMAIFHTCCGQIDLAADWIEKAIEERDPHAPPLLQNAIGEPLRLSPRWPKLAALMNLSASAGTSAPRT